MVVELKIEICLARKNWEELDYYINQEGYQVSKIKKDGRLRFYFLKRDKNG